MPCARRLFGRLHEVLVIAASVAVTVPSSAQEAPPSRDDEAEPSPLEVDYIQYGVAIAAELPVETGGICPSDAVAPCIIGIGGGPVLRGGYRPSGPWYFGGAYQFSKLDSNNLNSLFAQFGYGDYLKRGNGGLERSISTITTGRCGLMARLRRPPNSSMTSKDGAARR